MDDIVITVTDILIKKFFDYKRPVVIAIGGPGEVGKTTFAKKICEKLKNSDLLNLDSYKIERSIRPKGLEGPHPKVNNMNLIAEHLMLIKKGVYYGKYARNEGEKEIKIIDTTPAHYNIIDGEISTYPYFKDLVPIPIVQLLSM